MVDCRLYIEVAFTDSFDTWSLLLITVMISRFKDTNKPAFTKRHSNADEYASFYSIRRPQSVVTVSEDNSGKTIISVKDHATERVRIDSAIGIQRELQLACISLAQELYPMVRGIMESATPKLAKTVLSGQVLLSLHQPWNKDL
jgi:hypothetical protein